jgi:hypothetical protein
MNRRQAERWAITRASGRTCFVWLYGVALWGLMTTVLAGVVTAVLEGYDSLFDVSPLPTLWGLIGGYFWGVYVWKTGETEYARFLENPPTN